MLLIRNDFLDYIFLEWFNASGFTTKARKHERINIERHTSATEPERYKPMTNGYGTPTLRHFGTENCVINRMVTIIRTGEFRKNALNICESCRLISK